MKKDKNKSKINYLSFAMPQMGRVISELKDGLGLIDVGRYFALSHYFATLDSDNFRVNIKSKIHRRILKSKLEFSSETDLLEFLEVLVVLNMARYEYEKDDIIYSDIDDISDIENEKIFVYLPEIRDFYYGTILKRIERASKGGYAKSKKASAEKSGTETASNETSESDIPTIKTKNRKRLENVIEHIDVSKLKAGVSNEVKRSALVEQVMPKYIGTLITTDKHAINIINKALNDDRSLTNIGKTIKYRANNAQLSINNIISETSKSTAQYKKLNMEERLTYVSQNLNRWKSQATKCFELSKKYHIELPDAQKKFLESIFLIGTKKEAVQV